MKSTKPSVLKELSVPELQGKLREARENFFKLQIRKETRQIDDMVSVRVARRDIARMLTIIKQKQGGKA